MKNVEQELVNLDEITIKGLEDIISIVVEEFPETEMFIRMLMTDKLFEKLQENSLARK